MIKLTMEQKKANRKLANAKYASTHKRKTKQLYCNRKTKQLYCNRKTKQRKNKQLYCNRRIKQKYKAKPKSNNKESLPTSNDKESLSTTSTSTSSDPNENVNKNKNGYVPGSDDSRDTTIESPDVIDLLKGDNNNDDGNATEITRKVDLAIDKAQGRNTIKLLEDDNNDEGNENLNDQVPQRISLYCRSNQKDPNQVANITNDRTLPTGREDNIIDLLDDDDDDDEVIVVEKYCQYIERAIEDDDDNDNGEIQILGSTGMNALSDFAHSRADCVTYPFAKDPTIFCAQCYCYVCDTKASECIKWDAHCEARSSDIKWKQRRSQVRCNRKAPERELERLNFSWSSSLPIDLLARRTRRNVNYSEL